jgi:hypothetical protein
MKSKIIILRCKLITIKYKYMHNKKIFNKMYCHCIYKMFHERDFFVITSTQVLYKYMADLY